MTKYKDLKNLITELENKINELKDNDLIIQLDTGEIELVSRDDVEIVSNEEVIKNVNSKV